LLLFLKITLFFQLLTTKFPTRRATPGPIFPRAPITQISSARQFSPPSVSRSKWPSSPIWFEYSAKMRKFKFVTILTQFQFRCVTARFRTFFATWPTGRFEQKIKNLRLSEILTDNYIFFSVRLLDRPAKWPAQWTANLSPGAISKIYLARVARTWHRWVAIKCAYHRRRLFRFDIEIFYTFLTCPHFF